MAKNTLQKGTIYVASRERGVTSKKAVPGLISPSGLGIHKAIDRSGYTITHLQSGYVVTNTNTQQEAKEQVERIGKVTNWQKKEIKPSRELSEKLKYAIKGEKRPRKSTKPRDEYDLKAHARRGGNLVEHEQATGYQGQKKERTYIRRELK